MTFIPYAQKYSNSQINAVYTLLSWNGQQPNKTDFSSIITQVKKFADTLHTEFPSAKFKIMGVQVNSIRGGMGANYGASGSSYADDYGNVKTVLNQNDAFQEFANRDEYKNFVEFINISAQFDSDYNMPFSQHAVNTRNTSVTEQEFRYIHHSI